MLLDASSADDRRFTALVGDFGLAQAAMDDEAEAQAAAAAAEGGNELLDTGGGGEGWPVNSVEEEAVVFGTVTHQPPERLAEGVLTPAADIYALGVLLWVGGGGLGEGRGCGCGTELPGRRPGAAAAPRPAATAAASWRWQPLCLALHPRCPPLPSPPPPLCLQEMWSGQRAWAGCPFARIVYQVTMRATRLSFSDTTTPPDFKASTPPRRPRPRHPLLCCSLMQA